MPKEPNTPIGEIACPHRTCDLKASIFKFRTRAKEDWAKRRAGKLYCACPNGHRCEDQEYLLGEDATIWGEERSESAPEPDESAPVKTTEIPASAPVPKAPARTQAAPVPSKEPDPPKTRSKSWGFFQ